MRIWKCSCTRRANSASISSPSSLWTSPSSSSSSAYQAACRADICEASGTASRGASCTASPAAQQRLPEAGVSVESSSKGSSSQGSSAAVDMESSTTSASSKRCPAGGVSFSLAPRSSPSSDVAVPRLLRINRRWPRYFFLATSSRTGPSVHSPTAREDAGAVLPGSAGFGLRKASAWRTALRRLSRMRINRTSKTRTVADIHISRMCSRSRY
mmetsp:Transcript_100372/g.255393  ORF Transcript_100372/g.255393 Transcript_100372/m.255393 type:complete len:213 (-) Transcript_100372:997-1635(-)